MPIIVGVQMARTALVAAKFVTAGTAGSYVTPDVAGVSVRNNGKTVVHIKNGSGSSITITEKIGKTVQGQAVTSVTSTLGAGADKYYGPFPDDYNQEDGTENVYLDLSAITTVTVAAYTL